MKREFVVRVGLVIASLLLFVAVGEAVIRLVFPPAPFGDDLRLSFRFHPGQRLQMVSKYGEFDVHSTYNSVGMRDVEHALEKPAGTRRILILGDSFMEAKQVEMEETLARRLEGLLSADGPVEVINSGRSGTGAVDQHLVLRHFGIDRSPDLVIQAFFMNDVYNDLERAPDVEWSEAGIPQRMKRRPWELRFPLYLRDRWERLPFVQRRDLVTRVGILPEDPFAVLRLETDPENDAHWQRSLDAIEASADLAREHGAGYLLLVIPLSLQVDPGLRDAVAEAWRLDPDEITRDPQDRLLRFGRERGIDVVDLLPLLVANRDSDLYFVYDGHWTPAGHELVAEFVADLLREDFLREDSPGAGLPAP